MPVRFLSAAGVAVWMLIFLRCASESPNLAGGGSTEVENCKVMGYVYNPGGTPAAEARVLFYRVDADPGPGGGAAFDSAVTDTAGMYGFDSLAYDTFNVVASGDSGLAFRDSVILSPDSTRLSDTLHAPGTLRGVVRLQPNHDSRTVFVVALGTSFLTMPADSIGNFTLADIPGGRYTVRFITTLAEYSPLDTTLAVFAGVDTTLSDTIRLRYNGIPVPVGVTAVYDTLRRIATITWSVASAGRADGYMVYRRQPDSAYVVLTAAAIHNTLFRDTIFGPDGAYEYAVCAVDSDGTPGDPSAWIRVQAVSGFELVRTIGAGTGTGDGQFQGLPAIAVGPGGRIYAVDQGNYRVQVFDSTGLYLFQWGHLGSGDGELNDPRDIALDSAGFVYVAEYLNNRVQKFDSTGGFVSMWTAALVQPMAIDVAGPWVFVGEWEGGRLLKFDLDGNLVGQVQTPGSVSSVAAAETCVLALVDDSLVFVYTDECVAVGGLYASHQGARHLSAVGMRRTDATALICDPDKGTVLGLSLAGELIFVLRVDDGDARLLQDATEGGRLVVVAAGEGSILCYRRKL